MPRAKVGDRVRIQYARRVNQCPTGGKPRKRRTCEFTIGGSEVFATLSMGIIGMAPGERKSLTLQPAEAYGEVQPRLIRPIPRERFPKHLELHVGKRLTAIAGIAGRRRRVTVVEIGEEHVLIDANHPLAGQIVVLEVNLLAVDSSAKAKRSKPQVDVGGKR